MLGSRKESVGVVKPSLSNAVDPNHKCISEGRSCLRCRADEVGDGCPPPRNDTIAQQSHPSRMFNAVCVRKAEIAMGSSPHFVSIKNSGAKNRCQCTCQRRLASAWKSHDQNFDCHAVF